MGGNVPELNGFGPWILFRPWRAVSRVSMVYQAGRFAVIGPPSLFRRERGKFRQKRWK